jgi:hypothetical protein
MEGVRRARAVGRWIGERIENLELLDDRAAPPVGNDDRQRVFILRTNMDEMNIESLDLGDA